MKLTYADLIVAASSPDPKMRQQALEALTKWEKLAPSLEPHQRLTMIERSIIKQVLAKHA